MISDPNTAKQISQVMLDVAGRLNESTALVKDHCSPEESKAYSRAVGPVLWQLFSEVLDPIFMKHPSLKPPNYE